MKPEDLKEALRDFTGSEQFTRYSPMLFPKLIITEGLKFLAEEAGAYWLLDVVGSHLPSVKDRFAVVHLNRYGNRALFHITDDDPANITYCEQDIEFTDFPLEEIKMYLSFDGTYWVLRLCSEY